MFIRESVTIDVPIAACKDALLENPDSWLPHLVARAQAPSRDRLARLGFSVLGVPVSKQVRVHLGEPTVLRDWLHVPIAWHAEPASQAFPAFQGELQLRPSDPAVTTLVVTGTYEPPLGPLGRSADNLVMHGAAEATARRLARELATYIRTGTHPVAAGSKGTSGPTQTAVQSNRQTPNKNKEVRK